MIANRLKQLRIQKELNQVEFCKIFNLSSGRYSQYESGKRAPDYELLIKFADFYDVSTDYLLERETPISTPKPIEISLEDIELLQQIKKASADKQKAIELILNIEEKSVASGK